MDLTTLRADFSARIETCDDPADLVGLFILRAFVSGAEPAARSTRVVRVRADATLVPPGIEPALVAVEDARRVVLATGPGWTLAATRWKEGSAVVSVTAVSDDLAADVLAAATEGAEEPPPTDPGSVEVSFWHLGRHGTRRVSRTIEAPTWADIRDNYAASAVDQLDRLVAHQGPPPSGRLILLHGPPGTGKTTVLRALAQAWRPWCQVHHVVDPERMLDSSGYLLDVITDADDDDPWRLLVLEDCDELIRTGAKEGTGQAMARLLNLTDGVLGQGTKVLVCITTNEELSRLHPAVVRPGRCLAEIRVGPLPAAQARAWLGRDLPLGPDGITLAELCALRAEADPVSAPEPAAPVGTYL
jgi:hypothetical protein